MSSSNSKPTGVDLLVILAVIGGVGDVLGAVVFLVLTLVASSWLGILVGPGIVRLVLFVFSALSILLLFCGATSFFLAYGLSRGRGWAWSWALSSAIIGLAVSIIAIVVRIGVIGVASNALILYYLTKRDVKVFFGKALASDSKSTALVDGFCVNCGNRLNGKEAYCPSCGFRR